MARLSPHFPLAHGVLRVDDRRATPPPNQVLPILETSHDHACHSSRPEVCPALCGGRRRHHAYGCRGAQLYRRLRGAVSCLGHGNPAVLEAMAAQARQAAYVHTSFFTCEPAEKLAALIAENCGGDLNHVYFVDSGSEATETALKMARQYWLEAGQPQRTRVISRRRGRDQSYGPCAGQAACCSGA